VSEFLSGRTAGDEFTATPVATEQARRSAQDALGRCEAARSRILNTASINKLRMAEFGLKLAITFLTPDPLSLPNRRHTDQKYVDRRSAFGEGDFLTRGGHEVTRAGNYRHTEHHSLEK